jgi:acyl dehydratase
VSVPAAISLDRYRKLVGTCVGTSDWFAVTQDLIDQFARCTRDTQFIHVDSQRAAATPFGGTIAHGFLTLSLLTHLAEQSVPRIEGAAMGVNFGFNSVRFVSPVRAGHAIRGRFVLKAFAERKPGQWQSVLDVAVDLEGEERPALVAEWITMAFVPA